MTTAEYIPESVDKTEKFTVATTYCTGRVTVEYPINMPVAVRQYTRKVTSAVRQDNQSLPSFEGNPPVHIKRVDFIVRNDDGSIKSHIDTRQDVPTCGCSPVTEKQEPCQKCIDAHGQMPSPYGDSVLELEAWDEHQKNHVAPEQPGAE
jgi:hypothetical protein